jgi:hypothetical protein
LQESPARVADSEYREDRARVRQIWRDIMGG